MRVWSMCLRRTKSAIISWAGSFRISTIAIWLSYFDHCDRLFLWQNQQNKCAPSEDSDHPWYPPSLIRVFAVRMKKPWVLSYPLSAQQTLWLDWTDAQADLSLRWAHAHFVGFVMSQLILLCRHCRSWSETMFCASDKEFTLYPLFNANAMRIVKSSR